MKVLLVLLANALILCLLSSVEGAGPDRNLLRRGSTPEELPTPQSRIIGGYAVQPQDGWDFFAQWHCGGVLLETKDVILTAAHCAYQQGAFNAPVYLGGTSRDEGIERQIDAYSLHPSYLPSFSQAYDFMLIRLDEPVTSVTPAKLNTNRSWPYNGQHLTTMGYGFTQEGGPEKSDTLMQVHVNAIEDCELTYPAYEDRIFENVMFCAGVPQGGKDSCTGDSGGPIVDTISGLVMGVASWGDGCGRADSPGVYARVSTATDWIQRELCTLSRHPPDHCSRYLPTSPNPLPATASIRIDILYDLYPGETSWALRNIDSGILYASSGAGDWTWANALVYTPVHDLPHGAYLFEIADTFPDGICCEFGSGYVDIHLVSTASDGTETILHTLWELPGYFLDSMSVVVTV